VGEGDGTGEGDCRLGGRLPVGPPPPGRPAPFDAPPFNAPSFDAPPFRPRPGRTRLFDAPPPGARLLVRPHASGQGVPSGPDRPVRDSASFAAGDRLGGCVARRAGRAGKGAAPVPDWSGSARPAPRHDPDQSSAAVWFSGHGSSSGTVAIGSSSSAAAPTEHITSVGTELSPTSIATINA
jgi:hypothetical protein